MEGVREAWKASWEANKADELPGPRLRWAPPELETERRGGVGEVVVILQRTVVLNALAP